MKEVWFGGAAERVTGSRFVVTNNEGTRFGVDWGMFQGPDKEDNYRRNLESDDASQSEFTVFSHGHLDHTGLGNKSKGRCFATHPTKDLMAILLEDARKQSPFLYPEGSIGDLLRRTERINYDTPIFVDGSKITLRNAGHIMGSASIEIEEEGGDKIVFSGNLGNPHSRTMRPATLIKGANIVVMESTYGDRNHPEEDPAEVIMDAVARIMRSGGTLVMPLNSIDKAQAVPNIFKELREKKKLDPKMQVFLDAPMAIQVTEKVYMGYKLLLKDELAEQSNPFGFAGLTNAIDSKDSRAILHRRGPKIILASSGAMDGGRVLDHAWNYLGNEKNVFLFVGYPIKGTLSREIVDRKRGLIDKEKEVFIKDHGYMNVGATILESSCSSAHADQWTLFNWIKNIKEGDRSLRAVFLTHGEKEKMRIFADLIKTKLGIDAIIPKQGETHSLQ
jgi:metallo-beta-lactamase family protein